MSTNTSESALTLVPNQGDFLPLKGTDYVEIYVSNSKQAAHYFMTAFGFSAYAYSGLETGERDRESYVVQQDKIRIVLTSPLIGGTDVGKHIDEHGDGVKVIALWVDDATKSYNTTIAKGAKSYLEPMELVDDDGVVVQSGIHTYGDTVHIFVERKNYKGHFLPGFRAWNSELDTGKKVGLKFVDHMVGNVGWGEMNTWVDFYSEVMGFSQLMSFDDNDISTEYSALMSKVMSNGNGRIKFPINEPAEGKKKSQVEEYLDFYGGPGVQHMAIATDNIIETIAELQRRGVEFLNIPDSYYDGLLERVGSIDEDLEPLRRLGILVDRDDEGYLLQIFTKPLTPRPTLFFEIIQRKGAQSFGKGNFKALFEALELEQDKRGNL